MSEYRSGLAHVLQCAGVSRDSVKAFADWPSLEQVAQRFIQFVSPWLIVDGANFAERTLLEAIAAYDQALGTGYEAGHRKFLAVLAASASVLATLRVSVRDKDGLWVVWTYDEPLVRHVERFGRASIQIRKRVAPIDAGPVLIKLLATISPTHDLELAGLDLPDLLRAQELL